MTAEQRAEFERNPFWRDGLRLRRWDDEAKVIDAVTPSLEDLRESLVRALGERA